jgi:hypothetical protein
MLASLIMGLMFIISIVFFIWGIIVLISGKCKISKYPVKGKRAKSIGIGFVVVPVCLFVLYAILFEILDMGRSGTINALTVGPIIVSILFIVGIISVYYWALSKAKEYQDFLKAKELDP